MLKNLNIFQKVTILIITFKSYKIIEKCLDNLDQNFKKIIIENSNDKNFTAKLKNKYSNLECINIGYDSGFGYALNRGIEKVNTEYFISINPDSFPEEGCFEKLIKTADENPDVVMITPLTYTKNNKVFYTAGYFEKKKPLEVKKNNLKTVDWVNGNVFLLKKNVLDLTGLFDENIFLQYDERELQKRIFNIKKKIVINFNAKSYHLEGQSTDPKFKFEMKCEACWHTTWSRYYFHKKHYGIFYALKDILPSIIVYLAKYLIFSILLNKEKKKLYKLYLLGFYNSLFNKKSFYRAEID